MAPQRKKNLYENYLNKMYEGVKSIQKRGHNTGAIINSVKTWLVSQRRRSTNM